MSLVREYVQCAGRTVSLFAGVNLPANCAPNEFKQGGASHSLGDSLHFGGRHVDDLCFCAGDVFEVADGCALLKGAVGTVDATLRS